MQRLLYLGLASCVPTLPSHFAEGTEVLSPGKVGITAAGGFAAGGSDSGGAVGGGGELRARVGIGARSEIGASFLGAGHSRDDPSQSVPFLVGGKVSYKIAPVSWLALVGGAGAAVYVKTPDFGGDLAVIVAPYTAASGTQLYTGVRGAFAIPVLDNAHGSTESITIPIGVALHSSDSVRLIFEAGFVAGGAQFWEETSSTGQPLRGGCCASAYGYGLVGAHWSL